MDVVPFESRIDPSWVNRAVIVWCVGILVRSRSEQRAPTDVDDVVVEPARVLHREGHAPFPPGGGAGVHR